MVYIQAWQGDIPGIRCILGDNQSPTINYLFQSLAYPNQSPIYMVKYQEDNH